MSLAPNQSQSALYSGREPQLIWLSFSLPLAYLAASIGSIGLPEPDILQVVAIAAIAIGAMLLLASGRIKTTHAEMLIFGSLTLYFGLQLLRGGYPSLYLNKIDGVIIGNTLCYIVFRSFWRDQDSLIFFLRYFPIVCLTFLFFTILYKYEYGFADRQVRFFLNGPIIFGWMMAISSIISIASAFKLNSKIYYLIAAILIAAVIWSGSKGPIAALAPALIYLVVKSRVIGRGVVLLLAAVAATYLADMLDLIPERLQIFSNLLDVGFNRADTSSIGIRAQMWSVSWEIFSENPIFGVGIGNWSVSAGPYFTTFGLLYPHNLISEVVSEHGFMGFVLVLALLIAVFKRSDTIGKSIFIFSLTALLFTGDVEYWRFLIGMPLAMKYLS